MLVEDDADDALEDSEKYEDVDVIPVVLVDDVELEGLDTGVAGGEDSITWELEPGTLMVIGIWLAGEFVDGEELAGDTSLGRDDD